jgi:hypothetical protein
MVVSRSIFFLLAVLAAGPLLADIGIDWDESNHGVIYRESGEVRLVLCPGELADQKQISRDCNGGKITARMRENIYVPHLLLLRGMPEGYQSIDTALKIAGDLERKKREFESATRTKARTNLEEEVRNLEEMQHKFGEIRHVYLSALDGGSNSRFERKSDDWNRLFSSFSYWVGHVGRHWLKVSLGTWSELSSQCFSPWFEGDPHTDIGHPMDEYVKQIYGNLLPIELRRYGIWEWPEENGQGELRGPGNRYGFRPKGETQLIMCYLPIWGSEGAQ